MKRTIWLAALAALLVSADAFAVGELAQVAIIDRKSGIELVPRYYHGEYWVAGIPGATYTIAIRNRLGERLLAVTSVDGVNVISGATASWDQTGYVFDPGQGYEITGWRKSDSQVAAFTFTDSPSSYAERTGRPTNIGVIGVALFRERQPAQTYAPHTEPPVNPSAEDDESRLRAPDASTSKATESSAAPTPDRAEPAPPASLMKRAPKLGTGHGERETSYVTNTEFSRMQPQPDEVVRIRYDSLDNLVAMGVIPRPHRLVPVANPFPASAQQEYVPDPPLR
jgi:hypothetical protein